MAVIKTRTFVPLAEVKKNAPIGSSANLKSALQFFELMKNKLVADYANPDPRGTMTVYGRTLEGQDRYGTLGTFLLGQWMTDNTNLIENLSNVVANETKLYQDLNRLLTGG